MVARNRHKIIRRYVYDRANNAPYIRKCVCTQKMRICRERKTSAKLRSLYSKWNRVYQISNCLRRSITQNQKNKQQMKNENGRRKKQNDDFSCASHHSIVAKVKHSEWSGQSASAIYGSWRTHQLGWRKEREKPKLWNIFTYRWTGWNSKNFKFLSIRNRRNV